MLQCCLSLKTIGGGGGVYFTLYRGILLHHVIIRVVLIRDQLLHFYTNEELYPLSRKISNFCFCEKTYNRQIALDGDLCENVNVYVKIQS